MDSVTSAKNVYKFKVKRMHTWKELIWIFVHGSFNKHLYVIIYNLKLVLNLTKNVTICEPKQ